MKSFRTSLWILSVLLLILAGLARKYISSSSSAIPLQIGSAPTVVSTTSAPRVPQNAAATTSLQAVESQGRWQIYRNETYGFEIQYPATWQAEQFSGSDSWVEDPDPPMETGQLLMIDVPSSTIPESADVSAKIFLGASTGTVDVTDCATKAPEQIGGTTFYKFDYNDAAAGEFYYNVDHEINWNGVCYAVQYLFTSWQRADVGLSDTESIDPKTLVPILDRVLNTFRFTE